MPLEWIDIGAAHWVIALNSDFYEHNRVPIQNNYILLSLLLLISAIILIFILLIRGYNKKNQAYEASQRLIEKQKFENERHRLEKRILKESKLEAIGLLTTTIVHDMNNFLTPILGNAQLLMEDYAENEELVSELKEIYLAAERGRTFPRTYCVFPRSAKDSKILCMTFHKCSKTPLPKSRS